MEVSLSEQRDRAPRAASVLRFDQSEERWETTVSDVARVRVTRAKEAIRTHDGEAHCVLQLVADSLGLPLIRVDAPHARVSGNEERAVARIDPKPVDVNRSRVHRRGEGVSVGERLAVAVAECAQAEGRREHYHEQDSQNAGAEN